jgi:hypothetical protein
MVMRNFQNSYLIQLNLFKIAEIRNFAEFLQQKQQQKQGRQGINSLANS